MADAKAAQFAAFATASRCTCIHAHPSQPESQPWVARRIPSPKSGSGGRRSWYLVELEDGSYAYCQNYWSPFDGADLKDASFQDVNFRNADFRGALNIHDCSFSGAKGLNDCVFDDDEVKKRVQEAAKVTVG